MTTEAQTETPTEIQAEEAAPEIKKEAPKTTPAPSAPLMAQENGMIIGSSLEERFRVCRLYAASGMLPKAYDTPEKVFIGIQYALELGFRENPLTALRNIAVINGQPSLWGDLPLALCLRSGQMAHYDEWFEDKEGKRLSETCSKKDIWAAVFEIERKGYKRKKFAFTQEDKHTLGIAAIWNQFEKIMMKRKARAIGLKDVCPDILHGISIAEYDNHACLDAIEDKSTVTVLPASEEKLNNFADKFKSKKTVVEIPATEKKDVNSNT
jgi:hypothetical protein